MALNANDIPINSTPREILEAGTYPARIVQIVDLGVQPQRAYEGKEKPDCRELLVTYEFLDEFMKDEDGEEIKDKPRWLSETMRLYNLSQDKATSTKRYLALDPNMECKGNWADLIGLPVDLTIVHNPNKKTGVVYENVGHVSAMRAKAAQKASETVNPTVVFDYDAPDMEAYANLHDWIKKRMSTAVDFGSTLMAGENIPSAKKEDPKESPEEDLDDETPY